MIPRYSLPIFLLTIGVPVAAAKAQQLGGNTAADISLVRIFLALLVCILTALLSILFIRKYFKGNITSLISNISINQRKTRLIELQRITPHADLALVEFDQVQYLLVINTTNVILLKEKPSLMDQD